MNEDELIEKYGWPTPLVEFLDADIRPEEGKINYLLPGDEIKPIVWEQPEDVEE